MDRINIFTSDDPESGDSYLVGWFDRDRARQFDEDRRWNGSNHISVHTSSQWHHETLYRTATGGRWVLCKSSDYQGSRPSYEFITEDHAKTWLLINKDDAAVTQYFGPIEDERGPGRPVIGKKIEVRLDDEVIAAIDARAAREGRTRADLLRNVITAAFTPAAV